MPQTRRTIKKYPNRRLYDTEISSYITLEEIRQLVLDGEDFEVLDAKSGKDLTRSVLLQIISEYEEHGEPMLSTPLLTQIIGFYGDDLQGFIGPYLERSLQLFLEQEQPFRTQLDATLSEEPGMLLSELVQRNIKLCETMQQNLCDAAKPHGKSNPPLHENSVKRTR